MPKQRVVDWWKVDLPFAGLETDVEHEITVRREAIPLIFVPGIMGSRLRSGAATATVDGNYPNDGPDSLPEMRWDPSNKTWMGKNYLYRYAKHRKKMLIGESFNAKFLQVADTTPVGNGFRGIMEGYQPFLDLLVNQDWGPIGRIFAFPVYAFGYNWTDSAAAAGGMLMKRIDEIKTEAAAIVGSCEKVILVSHSMGGLVTRSCSELSGAKSTILGILHGVQPVTGATAAYWRIKGGFEGDKLPSGSLGNDGKDVTAVLGNSPGGLQLLPNKLFRTNQGDVAWLQVTHNGKIVNGLRLPKADPYAEIYRVPAVVVPPDKAKPSTNAFWALVDPDLLEPGAPAAAPGPASANDDAMDAAKKSPWQRYVGYLKIAEQFHDDLGVSHHPHTYWFAGSGHVTAGVIELKTEWRATIIQNYRTREFAGEYTDASGWDMKAILQSNTGTGDGTVPLSSSQRLSDAESAFPGLKTMPLTHQEAYVDPAAQAYAIQAIKALCLIRYREKR